MNIGNPIFVNFLEKIVGTESALRWALDTQVGTGCPGGHWMSRWELGRR